MGFPGIVSEPVRLPSRHQPNLVQNAQEQLGRTGEASGYRDYDIVVSIEDTDPYISWADTVSQLENDSTRDGGGDVRPHAILDMTPMIGGRRQGSRSLDIDDKLEGDWEPDINNDDEAGIDTGSKIPKPFHKWMKTLHQRAVRRHMGNVSSDAPSSFSPSYRRESCSNSSFSFVAAAKTASISLASGSLFTRSRRTTQLSSRGHSRGDWSSRASMSAMRFSEDSIGLDRSISMDPAVTERSMQRRRILEELIATEESYIGDVRFLMNVRGLFLPEIACVILTTWQVYITILASLPTLPAALRTSINRNLTDIVELHEEMLGDLHRVVPHSEYTQLDQPLNPPPSKPQGHHRWKSLGAVPENRGSFTRPQELPGMTVEPQIAAEVARIFSRKVSPRYMEGDGREASINHVCVTG
jgi:hypothetical protein